MKTHAKLIAVVWGIFVLLSLSGMFIITFYLTAYIYTLTRLNPPRLFVQLVNSLLGLVLMGLFISGIARFARSKGWMPEMNVFAPIIDAIQRITKGDFSVRLDDTLRDNHPVRALRQSVNEMALELNALEKMRQEFISNVSHEIQSPLTSIRGFALALRSDHLSAEERNHYLTIIEDESQRLSRITDNLLKLASLESREFKLEAKPYRLDKQIRNLILACEPQWTSKQIDMDVALDDVAVAADEDLLSQVWANLIHNAIKFTPEGGKISIALCRQNDKIEFKITDTGIGIPGSDQARVFERFYKADKSRRCSTEGSGLGLAIAKKIVEMHQGTIALESKTGAGATFIVTLPNEK